MHFLLGIEMNERPSHSPEIAGMPPSGQALRQQLDRFKSAFVKSRSLNRQASLPIVLVLAGVGAIGLALTADIVGIGKQAGMGGAKMVLALVGGTVLLVGIFEGALDSPIRHRYLSNWNIGRFARRRWLLILVVVSIALVGRSIIHPLSDPPEPWIHDEFSYLLAADTYAHGRLANLPHPFWVHFESPSVLQQERPWVVILG
jgi:hypothetical protein